MTGNIDRLAEDHDNAVRLAEGLGNVKGLFIENQVDTNIIMVNVEKADFRAEEFLHELKRLGILGVGFGPETV